MQPAGKEVSIISEEPGSKLIFITGKADAQVQIDIEKGKSKTPETLVVELAGLIDVKGLKANGNRVSQHDVKQIALVDATPEIGIELVEPIAVDDVEPLVTKVGESEEKINEDSSTVRDEDDETPVEMAEEIVVDEVVPEVVEVKVKAEPATVEQKEIPKVKKPVFKTETIKTEPKPASDEKVKIEGDEVEELKADKQTEEPKAPKKIELEITNPDIKIDDKGQLGFF